MFRRETIVLVLLVLAGASELFAMEAEPTRLTLWRKGEAIYGEEFVVFVEKIVDYIATLRRPTGMFEKIRYNCMVKSRNIRPSVINTGTSPPQYNYVNVQTVYELKDCVEEPESQENP